MILLLWISLNHIQLQIKRKQFLWYLVNAGRGDNPILGIVFPDNLNNLTNSLGLGALLFIFLFLNFKYNFKIILLISFYILLGYFLGQPSSTFFLEPYIWVILTLSQQKIKFNVEKITYNILRIQYIFLPAILFGAASIFPGNLNVNLMPKVLEKNANGYSLYRWANSEFEKLNYKGPILRIDQYLMQKIYLLVMIFYGLQNK